MARGTSSTIRALVCAWVVVAAIVGLGWLLRAEGEPPPPRVHARYEAQPAPAGPRVDLAPAAAAPVASADAAEVSSERAAEVAAIDSWRAQRPRGDRRLFGTVTARETGAAVAGVVVEARIDDWRWFPYASAVTGPDGAYELTDLPASTFVVTATSSTTDVVEHEASVVHLRDARERRLDLQVSFAGRVWGRVADSSGQPVRHVKVLLGTTDSIVSQMASLAVQRRPPLHATTDERGDYVVRGVPFEQEWVVWYDDDGHAPTLSPSFVLHPTRPQVRIDVTLDAGLTVHGRVVEPSGRAVPRAEVVCIPEYSALLAPMRRAHTGRKTLSDEDGAFVLPGIPAGDYQLLAFQDGYRFAFRGTPVFSEGRGELRGVEVVLRPSVEGDHAVSGVVVDGARAPVAGAHVVLTAVGAESLSVGAREATTGADGAFRFDGVGEGALLLTAGREGFRPRVVEQVKLDRPTVVQLEREATVSGVVLLPGGQPAAAFSVRVVRAAGDEPGSLLGAVEALGTERTFSGTEGRFHLQAVPPGRVLLEARAPEHAPGRLEVEVRPEAALTDVRLQLPATGAVVRGAVTAPGGAPVKGARVWLTELGGAAGGVLALADRARRPTATTDERGRFALEGLASAAYALTAEHRDFAPTTLRPIVVAAGQPLEQTVVLRAGGTVEVRARPGVMVTLAGDAFSAMQATDDAGRCRFARVPAGSYLLRAVVGEGTRLLDAPEVHRRGLRVEEGGTTAVELLEAAPQGRTVTGRVDPPPPEGSLAMVLLRVPGSPPPDPADLVFQGALGVSDGEAARFVVAEALARPDGTFSLPDVPPGRYTQDVYTTTLLASLAGAPATLQDRKEVQVD